MTKKYNDMRQIYSGKKRIYHETRIKERTRETPRARGRKNIEGMIEILAIPGIMPAIIFKRVKR